MEIKMNSGNNPAYEPMMEELLRETFGFSFNPWFALKLWDDRYESYSIVEDGRMLSNVCIYKTDILLQGQVVRANQFGGVCTRQSERGKGYSRMLMAYIDSLYPDTPAFLCANPSVMDFYPRFGFRQIQTYHPCVEVKIDNQAGNAVKCTYTDERVQKALYGERVYSGILDCKNAQSIQIFNLMMEYADDIYDLPNHRAIVVAKQIGDELFVAGVISEKQVRFDEILKELPFSGVRKVVFGFCADWLEIDAMSMHWESEDKEDPVFIRGWSLPKEICFPVLSRT